MKESHMVKVRGPWVKSSKSVSGNCVEMAEIGGSNDIALRNSRNPEGPVLIFTRSEIDAMIKGAAAGDFNQFAA